MGLIGINFMQNNPSQVVEFQVRDARHALEPVSPETKECDVVELAPDKKNSLGKSSPNPENAKQKTALWEYCAWGILICFAAHVFTALGIQVYESGIPFIGKSKSGDAIHDSLTHVESWQLEKEKEVIIEPVELIPHLETPDLKPTQESTVGQKQLEEKPTTQLATAQTQITEADATEPHPEIAKVSQDVPDTQEGPVVKTASREEVIDQGQSTFGPSLSAPPRLNR